MNITIIHGDLEAVRALPDRSVNLLVVILGIEDYLHRMLARTYAAQKLVEGGELILAGSLPEAFAAL